jgi:flagellar hook-basal body complex protein FliE
MKITDIIRDRSFLPVNQQKLRELDPEALAGQFGDINVTPNEIPGMPAGQSGNVIGFPAGSGVPRGAKFTDTLNEFIGDVNSLGKESASKIESFIKGEPVDIHDVMISAQKAKTSFQLLMELRNKGLELYREVNRMQV